MSDLSTTLRNALYNHIIAGTQHTAPAGLFLALSTNGSSEIAGNGYARANVRAAFGSPTNGVGANTAEVEMPESTGDQGTITHAALFDASSGGVQLTQWKALAASRAVPTGTILRFPVGDLDFSIQ